MFRYLARQKRDIRPARTITGTRTIAEVRVRQRAPARADAARAEGPTGAPLLTACPMDPAMLIGDLATLVVNARISEDPPRPARRARCTLQPFKFLVRRHHSHFLDRLPPRYVFPRGRDTRVPYSTAFSEEIFQNELTRFRGVCWAGRQGGEDAETHSPYPAQSSAADGRTSARWAAVEGTGALV